MRAQAPKQGSLEKLIRDYISTHSHETKNNPKFVFPFLGLDSDPNGALTRISHERIVKVLISLGLRQPEVEVYFSRLLKTQSSRK